ncbi:MAG TPA: hypothetical protein VNA14_11015 [Mycobacteriales bacterium]|nr:hypothetical protein [Mycobacteriales bacterium]
MRSFIVAITASACVGALAPPAAATHEGHVHPHQHYITNANGDRMPIGPNACQNGPSRQFDNFHNNVHRGEPGQGGRDHSPRHDDPAVVGLGCPS